MHIDRKLGIKGKHEYEYVHAHALTQTFTVSTVLKTIQIVFQGLGFVFIS